MTQPQKTPLSEVPPLLVAALVCDVAVADPATGKKNLIGIFDQVRVGKSPDSARSPCTSRMETPRAATSST